MLALNFPASPRVRPKLTFCHKRCEKELIKSVGRGDEGPSRIESCKTLGKDSMARGQVGVMV